MEKAQPILLFGCPQTIERVELKLFSIRERMLFPESDGKLLYVEGVGGKLSVVAHHGLVCLWSDADV